MAQKRRRGRPTVSTCIRPLELANVMGISDSELARCVGVTGATISKWRRFPKRIPLWAAIALAKLTLPRITSVEDLAAFEDDEIFTEEGLKCLEIIRDLREHNHPATW